VRLSFIFALALLVFSALFPPNLPGQLVGQGSFSKTAGSYTPEYLPAVDVRQFFTTPYPTASQAQSQDFGAVLASAFSFAATGGVGCVDLSGLSTVGTLYATTNPFAGMTTSSSQPCLKGGNVTVVTSVMWSTPNGTLYVEGDPPPFPGGLFLQPCNTNLGCSNGSGGLNVPQYLTSTQCSNGSTSGANSCVSSFAFSSIAPTPYLGSANSSTISVTNGSATASISGGTTSQNWVGGTLMANCNNSSGTAVNCTPVGSGGSVNKYDAMRIINVSPVGGCIISACTLTLEATWPGATLANGDYVVWPANTSVVICDGCLGAAANVDTFEHVWRNIGIDLNGLGGSGPTTLGGGLVGYFTRDAQEGTEYDNLQVYMNRSTTNTPSLAGMCGMWDGSLRGSAGNTFATQNNTGVGHANSQLLGCSMSKGKSLTQTGFCYGCTYGWGWESHDQMLNKSQSGPNFTNTGTVEGTSSANFEDCIVVDGLQRGVWSGGHCEFASNDDIEIGPEYPVLGVTFLGFDYANTPGPTNIVENHVGSYANAYIDIFDGINGCIVADDNLAPANTCTKTAATSTPSTQGETYFSSATSDISIVTGGGITANGSLMAPAFDVANSAVTSVGSPYTVGDLACILSSGIGNCPSASANVTSIGVLVAQVGSPLTPAYATAGIVQVNSNAAASFTQGDYVCSDPVNLGVVVDNGTAPCPSGQVKVGIVALTDSSVTSHWVALNSSSQTTGPTTPLNNIAAATGSATIGNGNNPIAWDWSQTTASQIGLAIGETTPSTNGRGSQYLASVSTLLGSTSSPLRLSNSLNGSQTLCALCILPTWNTTGNVDAAILVNVTNAASGSTSKLLDLQTGGGTPTSEFSVGKSGNVGQAGIISSYNAISTVDDGVPAEYAHANLTAQSAAISSTLLYAVPATGGTGMYRISWSAKVTRASSTGSTLGGGNGFQINYTDADDSVVVTTPPSVTSTGNTTGTQISGVVVVNAKSSTNIQYSFGYTSSGSTSMQYSLHVKLEAM
jgi:hypothetical protein